MKPNANLVRRITLISLVLLLVGALAFVALRTGPLAPTRVTVAPVKEGRLTPSLFGIGTVEARRAWLIGPTVAGRVLSVKVDVGDAVKAGQLLAEMDPVDLDQRVAALDATLARAGSTQAAAQAQTLDAKARRELAALNAKRNQDLAKQNFISAGALESRLQEQASADAALQAAQANLAGTGQDLTRLKAERAGLAQQRGNMRLLAPADGVVASRDAEAGSTVVAGQAVVRLVDPASLWVRLRVDQGRSVGLATGLAASIVLRSQPQTPLAGAVARVELMADSVTEERIAQVSFSQTPAHASIGEMAEVTLQLPQTESALVVPNAAIARVQGQAGVWRMAGGKPEFVPLTLGAHSLDGWVQVKAIANQAASTDNKALKSADSIIVYSQKAITASSRVKVVDALVKPEAAP
jgi:HlyD family secretion protein